MTKDQLDTPSTFLENPAATTFCLLAVYESRKVARSLFERELFAGAKVSRASK
jgi:hypothetical protein